MKVSFGDPDSLISLSPAEGSTAWSYTNCYIWYHGGKQERRCRTACNWMKEPRWKCRHFRWARLQGAYFGSLIISWRWPIEWYRPRLTKITPSPIRPARPRRLRSRRRDGFWTGPAPIRCKKRMCFLVNSARRRRKFFEGPGASTYARPRGDLFRAYAFVLRGRRPPTH